MRIAHVVPSIHDEASGPSVSVRRLAEEQSKLGHKVSLHVLDYGPIPKVEGVTVHRSPILWENSAFGRTVGISLPFLDELRSAAANVDVIHNHSLWMFPNIVAPMVAREAGCLSVLSPRGTLHPWALQRRAWTKKLLWALVQGRAVEGADLVHATSEVEAAHVHSFRVNAKTCVLPNGVDVPPCATIEPKGDFVLYLGRIHPVKGLEALLEAWSLVERSNCHTELRIVGKGDSHYVEGLKTLAKTMGLVRVRWLGPQYGAEKWRTLRAARVFALTSHSENFAMSVAEALACGTPAVVTHGAPWQLLDGEKLGAWVPQDASAIADALARWLLPELEAVRTSKRCETYVRENLSWSAVGRGLTDAIANLV
jgi:glycosyltransferase involved in cell wall biosynthesis